MDELKRLYCDGRRQLRRHERYAKIAKHYSKMYHHHIRIEMASVFFGLVAGFAYAVTDSTMFLVFGAVFGWIFIRHTIKENKARRKLDKAHSRMGDAMTSMENTVTIINYIEKQNEIHID